LSFVPPPPPERGIMKAPFSNLQSKSQRGMAKPLPRFGGFSQRECFPECSNRQPISPITFQRYPNLYPSESRIVMEHQPIYAIRL
jgi:hypothetical protein